MCTSVRPIPGSAFLTTVSSSAHPQFMAVMSCPRNWACPSSPSSIHIHPSHPSHLPTHPSQPRPLQPLPGASGGLAYSLTFPDSECHAMGSLKPWARYLLLVMAHLLVMGLGAVVLQALEGPPALHLQAQLRAELATFQAEHRACLPPEALEELLGAVLRAQAHGVSSSLGNGSETSNWDLPSALLFTASVLTTTGRPPPPPGEPGGGPKSYRVQALFPPEAPDKAMALSGLTSQLGLPTQHTPTGAST